ncbi:efflux RND transporter permease subunit [Arenimonas fontis]|uniref:MMPL family transporter n=1 Tax=Arenimonas fontis TaxID=2608255 RepID=A0A5B2Z8H7_9GAMM|nr:MMPL family transporter [Arenimonas fontis]KAA2285028.1 MMPL family transporter [Arenimonas fontis]
MSLPNAQPGPFARFAEKLVFSNRPLILVLFAAVTVAMLYFASQLKVDAGFKKQIPLQHEYMQTFLEYEADFGGANRVLVAVIARDGDMFDQRFMRTLENVTNEVINLDATDDARSRSLFTPNVRFIEVVEDGLSGGNVIPATFTPNVEGFQATDEDFETIRGNIVKAGIVGRLVARDYSGAMIWADLIPESDVNKVDYQEVARQFEAIRQKYEDEHHSVHIIGFAKMVGDISDGARSVVKFFALTIAFTWLLLFLYSTSAKLASLTVFAAMVSVVWMLGALQLMGFGIDPMNMLTPFLIFAIAVSHGEQMINRFRGEIFFGGLEEGTVDELRAKASLAHPPLEAARNAFRMLLVPGTVALLAGCIGFGAIMVIPIDMVRELAITATVGVALTILTDLVLLPVLLSYTRLRNLDRKREYRLRQLTRFDRIWAALARLSKPSLAALVVAIGLAGWYFAWQHGNKVMIGDAQQGVAELHPDARYNQDAVLISEKFSLGVDIMNVIAEAGPSACTTSYPAMELIDRFAWHMENVPGVEQVITLPAAAKLVNAGWNDGSLRWRILPRDPDTLRQATQNFETDSGLLNADCSAMPVTIFTSDHKADTIDRLVGAVKEFRQANGAYVDGNLRERLAEQAAEEPGFTSDKVNLRLATGNLGVMAATNDTVRASEHVILYLLYAAVFLMCWISFRNPLAALCVLLPLILVTELGHSLMVELDIGMKVNTLCVVALGVGIGVDYGIYIFARMREAMQQGRGVAESYFIALKTTGIAIFYTALTLAVGVAMWIFSDLKFQADMGVMLTFMFVVNMVAAIIFLPALCRWLLRPREKDDWRPRL